MCFELQIVSWSYREKKIIFYILPGLTATIWELHIQGRKLRVKSKAIVIGKVHKFCFFQQLSKTTSVWKRPALRCDAIFPSYPLTALNKSWASFSAIMEKKFFFNFLPSTPQPPTPPFLYWSFGLDFLLVDQSLANTCYGVGVRDQQQRRRWEMRGCPSMAQRQQLPRSAGGSRRDQGCQDR